MILRCESETGCYWCTRYRCWFCNHVLAFRGAACSHCHAHQGGQADIDLGYRKPGCFVQPPAASVQK